MTWFRASAPLIIAGLIAATSVADDAATNSRDGAPLDRGDAAKLINKLRSGTHPSAVKEAVFELYYAPSEVRAALLQALCSRDRALRQRAAYVIRMRDAGAPPKVPDTPLDRHALIATIIDGLRHDEFPVSTLRASSLHDDIDLFNAADGVRWLSEHSTETETMLVGALRSDDRQQRFLAAAALAFGERTVQTGPACAVLIPHLRHNDVPGDATWAACAIARLGAYARSELTTALAQETDGQCRAWLQRLLRRLDHPPPVDPALQRGPRELLIQWGASITTSRFTEQ